MRKRMQFSVERPRLERELNRMEAGGLGVIAGSAGYGKSSSVASWASRLALPCAGSAAQRGSLTHCSLPPKKMVAPGCRGSVAPREEERHRRYAASLCADLAAPYASLTLIIDNADTLTEDPDSLALLRAVASETPTVLG